MSSFGKSRTKKKIEEGDGEEKEGEEEEETRATQKESTTN